jgi:hypothetical protein
MKAPPLTHGAVVRTHRPAQQLALAYRDRNVTRGGSQPLVCTGFAAAQGVLLKAPRGARPALRQARSSICTSLLFPCRGETWEAGRGTGAKHTASGKNFPPRQTQAQHTKNDEHTTRWCRRRDGWYHIVVVLYFLCLFFVFLARFALVIL